MLSRRTMLLAPLASIGRHAGSAPPSPPRRRRRSWEEDVVSHSTRTRPPAAGYRRSLEGWARAGIKNVEITAQLLDEFLKTDSARSREAEFSLTSG